PHSENCTALREDDGVNLRWALTYDHEAHPVLAPLFCDTPHGRSSRAAMFPAQIRMRFFEHKHQWALTAAFGQVPCPKKSVIENAQQGSDEVVQYGRRNARQIENRDRR